jgi:hypothetical protein
MHTCLSCKYSSLTATHVAELLQVPSLAHVSHHHHLLVGLKAAAQPHHVAARLHLLKDANLQQQKPSNPTSLRISLPCRRVQNNVHCSAYTSGYLLHHDLRLLQHPASAC